ncbi:MAG: hypothetical protein WAQ99_00660 [Pyrinomonadaceae bacterium]
MSRAASICSYFCALLISLAVATTGFGQQSHVSIVHLIDQTIVKSDVLYVINMPSQFMQLQFNGRHAKQNNPGSLPDQINVEFSSFAQRPLYENDLAHQFRVKADDEIIDFGSLSYSKVAEGNGQPSKDNTSVRARLPRTALIAKADVLTLERMSMLHADLDDLAKISKAKSVVMKLGDTVFPLTPIHLSILREFVEAMIRAGGLAPPQPTISEVPANVPSDANKASLDETLKWIKTHLDREGMTNDSSKLEPFNFKTCRVSYRLIPRFRETMVSSKLVYAIMEVQMDLGDLSLETLRANKLGNTSTLFIATRDNQLKIKVLKHANENGAMGRTLDEASYASTLIQLKSVDAANSLRVALQHAINLCQAQR